MSGRFRAADSPGPRAAALALSITAALRREGPAPVILIGGEDRTGQTRSNCRRGAGAAHAGVPDRTPPIFPPTGASATLWPSFSTVSSRCPCGGDDRGHRRDRCDGGSPRRRHPGPVGHRRPRTRAPRARRACGSICRTLTRTNAVKCGGLPFAIGPQSDRGWSSLPNAFRSTRPVSSPRRRPPDSPTPPRSSTLCGRRPANRDGRASKGWPSASRPTPPGTTSCCRRISCEILRDLAGHLRHAWTVNHAWGWLATSGAGPRCGGAASAGRQRHRQDARRRGPRRPSSELDLYRIDLSQVVSKYIGETEKNLAPDLRRGRARRRHPALRRGRRAVRQAQRGQGQPRPLRQRRGQLPAAADGGLSRSGDPDDEPAERARPGVPAAAPLRRHLPVPRRSRARAEIWSRVFPPETPTEGLDPRRLARLGLAGGSIRVDRAQRRVPCRRERRPVTMRHVLRAARREYGKLEKPFTATESEAFQ